MHAQESPDKYNNCVITRLNHLAAYDINKLTYTVGDVLHA